LGRVRLLPVITIATIAACSSSREPQLAAIAPAEVTALRATPVALRGEALYVDAHVDLDGDDPARVDRGWTVRAGDVALDGVVWIDPEHVTATVPSGMAPGTYDVIATSPGGHRAILPAGLVVTAEPLGLMLAVEDAPGGAGHAVGGTLVAGDTRSAYAVVRDEHGAFIADIDVAWSTTTPIGTIASAPASSAQLQATKVGTGRIVATRSAAQLTAQSEDLTVIAGVPATLVIDDAPGGAGQPIGDRMGLTTDPPGGLVAYATARDAFGNFAGDILATWSLAGVTGVLPGAPAATASVDFSTPGTGVLQASASFGDAQTGNLEVSPGKAAQLAIAPPSLSISADAPPVTFAASGTDADGNATTDLGTLQWSIASGPITALDTQSGALDPAHAGTGTIAVASSYGATATSGTITVTPGAAAALAIAPPSLSISADAAPVTFTASATDADGNATTSTGSITWSVASGPITQLSGTGVLDPRVAGSGLIQAQSSLGAAQTAPVTITPGKAASLVVLPDALDVVQGGTAVAFTATGSDADGNATTDLGTISWSKAGTFSVLDGAGMLTPVTPGTGSVRATSSYGVLDDSGMVRVRQQATLTAAMSAEAPTLDVMATMMLTLTVANTGQSDAANVIPCALQQIAGGGSVQLGAPSPSSTTVPAGGQAQFTWVVTGGSQGFVKLQGCASGNDATTLNAVTSPNTTAQLTVAPAKSLGATLAVPSLVGRGTPFGVTLTVTNNGSSTATGVTPSALNKLGSAPVTLVGSPAGGVSLLPGGTTTFTWTYKATAPGTVKFSGMVTGTDSATNATVVSGTVQSNQGDVVEAAVVDVDPFNDGSKFGFVTGYHGAVVLGPNATGTRAVSFVPDGTPQQTFTFSIAKDTNGHTMQNSSSGPYPSFGAPGCTVDTLTCGPDDEDARGSFATVTVANTEWLVSASTRAAGNNAHYVYMTADTDNTLDFSYVDISAIFTDHAVGVSALTALADIVYLGFSGDDANRPRLAALKTMPAAPGLDATSAQLVDLKIKNLNLGVTTPDKIDAMTSFANRLYLASDGAWVRATVVAPRAVDVGPTDWSVITPSAAAYGAKTSRTSTKTGNWEPVDRAVPQMAAFGGRLFVGRNTTTGPQLWSCDPTRSGDPVQCDAADWAFVAPNTGTCPIFACSGDTKLTQFDDDSLTTISIVVATNNYLYIGFDSANGVKVYRTANPAAATEGDFEGAAGCAASSQSCSGYGGSGFGNAAVTRIFDGKALTFSAGSSVWITAGSATTPMVLVEIP
jgi:hypothetical protein